MMLKIIYRNLVHKPLNGLLSLTLLSLSVAIISLLMVAGSQVSGKLDNDLQGIDMVVGAKGSPLQLVLSAVYHVDAPTGNIPKAEADKLLRNPMVESAIPLAYGDSYKGFRIVGTTLAYPGLYQATLGQGQWFEKAMEIVVGADIAKKEKLQIGSNFHSTHGDDARGQVHDAASFRVVGILNPTGTVLDQLLLTRLESVWEMHADHDDHEAHQEEGHGAETSPGQAEETEITALLVKFRSPMGIMMLPRMINENSTMQAAVPTLEINRLMNLMGIGIATLQGIAFAIMLIAGLSVFVSLYNRLKERMFELALIRTMGASRQMIFLLLLAEGLLLSVAGFFAGVSLCRLGLNLLNRTAARDFKFSFSYHWVQQEWWLFGVTVFIGIFAAATPAIKAYRLNIAKTLGDG